MSYTPPRNFRINNVNPGTITAGSSYEANIPVPGVNQGDVVVANCVSGNLGGQFIVHGYPAGPSNPNIVYLRITNVSNSNLDPGALDYSVTVFRAN